MNANESQPCARYPWDGGRNVRPFWQTIDERRRRRVLSEHDKPTIVSMAVIASATATLLHEGVGHGE